MKASRKNMEHVISSSLKLPDNFKIIDLVPLAETGAPNVHVMLFEYNGKKMQLHVECSEFWFTWAVLVWHKKKKKWKSYYGGVEDWKNYPHLETTGNRGYNYYSYEESHVVPFAIVGFQYAIAKVVKIF